MSDYLKLWINLESIEDKSIENRNLITGRVMNFSELIKRNYHDPNKVLVISYRTRLPGIEDEVVWNFHYNDILDQINESKRLEKTTTSKETKKEYKIIHHKDSGVVTRANEDSFVISCINKYECLMNSCQELNIKFDDNLTPENSMDIIKGFTPIFTFKKPTEVSFEKIIIEHNKILKSSLREVESKYESVNSCDYKEKFDGLQRKLRSLKSHVDKIMIKYNKNKSVNYNKWVSDEGFIGSLKHIVSYFDSTYVSEEEFDSDYDLQTSD